MSPVDVVIVVFVLAVGLVAAVAYWGGSPARPGASWGPETPAPRPSPPAPQPRPAPPPAVPSLKAAGPGLQVARTALATRDDVAFALGSLTLERLTDAEREARLQKVQPDDPSLWPADVQSALLSSGHLMETLRFDLAADGPHPLRPFLDGQDLGLRPLSVLDPRVAMVEREHVREFVDALHAVKGSPPPESVTLIKLLLQVAQRARDEGESVLVIR